MATKRISELTLRSDFDATCNVPVDDSTQSYRTTGAQILAFIAAGLTRATIPAGVIAKRIVATKTGAYTLLSASDDVILADATSAGFTLTLPASSGLTGRVFVIKKIDSSANVVTVDGNASETIDGETTLSLYNQYESVKIMSDGTNWVVIA